MCKVLNLVRVKKRLSLKGRGLQLLAQREHSRLELRRKLLAYARAEQQIARADAARRQVVDLAAAQEAVPPDAFSHAGVALRALTATRAPCPETQSGAEAEAEAEPDLEATVEALLDWLQANRYLSEERFAESRVHARQARFGNLRIQQELAQHGVALSADETQSLRDNELARAREVWLRKFGQPPQNASERGKQMRFLAGRGFSGDVIRKVVQGAGDD